ncbi:cysteine-rich secretory protein-related [Holotrichia oblita]|uniref:Cysteine-rich secretory protein-related n=1 Tax=Holotrichia oblita TaxID=644536 RepID=A0ACB9TBS4_HOLOL|nr:cysteine-rich secretory protein-related [Holotrichia oblita]
MAALLSYQDQSLILCVKESVKEYEAVKEKQIGYLKAAKEFQVTKTTLFRLCQKKGTPEQISKIKLGRPPVFSRELENELENHLLEMDKSYFGITRMDVRRLAYQLAVSNDIEHAAGWTNMSKSLFCRDTQD